MRKLSKYSNRLIITTSNRISISWSLESPSSMKNVQSQSGLPMTQRKGYSRFVIIILKEIKLSFQFSRQILFIAFSLLACIIAIFIIEDASATTSMSNVVNTGQALVRNLSRLQSTSIPPDNTLDTETQVHTITMTVEVSQSPTVSFQCFGIKIILT